MYHNVLTAVRDILANLSIDNDVIESIATSMERSAEQADSRVAAVPRRALGESSRGGAFGWHADLAHDHVTRGVTAMVEELYGVGSLLREFGAAHRENDNDQADVFRALNARLSGEGLG